MNKIILVLFLFGFLGFASAQDKPTLNDRINSDTNNTINSGRIGDSLRRGSTKSTSNKNIKNKDAKITDYLIISHKNDTTYVDTTLTIKKEYKYNYLREDSFELMPFSNLGQSYNTLSRDTKNEALMPVFGARARHFNYMEISDINYYNVPTPLTELFYKSAFEQGQLLDGFFTTNTSKQLNFSVAYKGLRSLGKYQHILTSTGNFRSTVSYKTKNRRYVVNAHYVTQDLLNQENGGLTDDNVLLFESGDKDLRDRSRLEVNFEDAENILFGKRFYLNHVYSVIKKRDSLSNNDIKIRHILSLEDKKYRFEQSLQNEFFGESFKPTNIRDEVRLEEFKNTLQLEYSNNVIGDINLNVSNTNYNYGYDKQVFLNGNTIPNRLKGDVFAIGGNYKKTIKGFVLQGQLGANISGDFTGNYFTINANYNLTDDIGLFAQINHNSARPNYNALLYQSDYKNYNWRNKFNNVETQQLSFKVTSKKLINIQADFSTIDDYVYFGSNQINGSVKPFQNDKAISYIRLKVNKEFKYANFGLNNTVMYQSVNDKNLVFNVPEIVTRNTLYYENHVFKKAMFLQTGVTFNYFTEYFMNGYDPLLAEFYTQTERKYGGFPMLDFFVNAKIRQTRIYLKAEHFNSSFTGYNFYSAPNNPYRDFNFRFGVVWNFFL